MRSSKLLPLALLQLSDEQEIEGITRFQKLVFLAQKEIEGLGTREYSFKEYKYGPFSKELYDDLDRLVATGYIARDTVETHNGNKKQVYRITEKGEEYIGQILEVGNNQSDLNVGKLQSLKEEYNNMPILGLIRRVYSEYPDYAENSKLDI